MYLSVNVGFDILMLINLVYIFILIFISFDVKKID